MRRLSLLLLLFTFVSFGQTPQRPAITGVAFFRMYAADPATSASFYSKTLGLPGKESAGVTRYTVNSSQWLEVKPLPSPAPVSRMEAVAFTTRDVAALERYLKAHSVAIVQPLKDGSFGVHDPEGNLILFLQQGVKPAGLPAPSPDAPSHRIIHAGFMVADRANEDAFWQGILGFRPYWYGGPKPDAINWVSLQVPDGSDWIEYMLNNPPNPTLQHIGVMDHFSLGVVNMKDTVAKLAANHCEGPNCTKSQMGKDGKVQLNLYDPDLTRVEFMEFQPSEKPCCSEFTGKHPSETEDQ
ncbi:MAG TPA: VOC family protein [Edaphobacter sp.]|jgi:catechol 2,3-dioxygenase-like lactoylglutathione lyase family enzyme|nr:VOC family protein [Edaphobacter sp.]